MNPILHVIWRRAWRSMLCLALAGLPVGARSQGAAFTYQGRLAAGTNAVTGLYDLRFAVYDAASGGA